MISWGYTPVFECNSHTLAREFGEEKGIIKMRFTIKSDVNDRY